MRRARYVALLTGVAAIAIAVPIAQGTSGAKDPRVTKLIKTVNALKGQVASLRSEADALRTDVDALKQTAGTLTTGLGSLQSCVKYKALPVTDYGTAAAEGYVYATDNGANLFLTTALDITAQGQTPQLWLNEVNPSCVSASASARRTTAGARRGTQANAGASGVTIR
jgi:outer membrane murein-binding lipoprotein Lpp